ncbi:MAG: hypothetical protein ACM3X9_14275 [Bacillota bacterium]
MVLAEKQRISDNLYSNQPAKKIYCKRSEGFKILIGIGGAFLCLTLANLWVQVLVVKQNDQLKASREAIRALERETVQVRMEMAKLESFERIQTIAQKDLGMKIAGPGDYRCITPAPPVNKNGSRPYNYVAKSDAQNSHLWAKLASWFEGVRSAMAQSAEN